MCLKSSLYVAILLGALSCKGRHVSGVSGSSDARECTGVSLGSCAKALTGTAAWRMELDPADGVERFVVFDPAGGGTLRWRAIHAAVGRRQMQVHGGTFEIAQDDRLVLSVTESSCANAPGLTRDGFKSTMIFAYAHHLGNERLYLREIGETWPYQSWVEHRQFVRQPSADPGVYLPRGYSAYVPASLGEVPTFETGCFKAPRDFIALPVAGLRVGEGRQRAQSEGYE